MNKPIQVPMPRTALPILMKQGGKGKYSLSELQELIDPVYRVYEEQIRRCITGLIGYAAQCAAARHEEQIPKLREHIVMMGGFWGIEEDASVDPYEISEQKYRRPFDEAIVEARQTGTAPPLTEQAKWDVLTGLEVHRQEMENSGGLDDLIAGCEQISQQLRAEWNMEPPESQQTVLTMDGMTP